MRIAQITLGAGKTQLLLPQNVQYAQWITIQNASATNTLQVGDSSVTATTGIQLNIGQSLTITAPVDGVMLLGEYWFYGTSGQLVNIMYVG